MTWQTYKIAGSVYPTKHAASLYLRVNEVTLERIRAMNLDSSDENYLIKTIKEGYQLYGEPFQVDGKWFVSLTHFAEIIKVSRTSLEYHLNKGETLDSLYRRYLKQESDY